MARERHRATHALGRPWLPIAVVLAVVAIVWSAVLLQHHVNSINAGTVPSSPGLTPVTSGSTSPTAPAPSVTRLTDAPTIPAGTVGTRTTDASPAAKARVPDAGPLTLSRLRIAAIDVDAPVVSVGVGQQGLDIPNDPRVLGWWNGGAQPGDPYGSVVVAGHVDTRALDGALFKLRHLQVGATIVAIGSDRRTVTYRVTGLREVAKLDLDSLDVFDQETEPRLVVITCGGPFNSHTHSYADNVIAFAVPT